MKLLPHLAAAIITLSAGTNATADMRDFTLVNNTAWPMYRVYIAEPEARHWGGDVLGATATLGPGRYTDVEFTGGRSCVNDIRIVFNGSVDLKWSNVNFCRVSKMTVWYDFASRQYQAQWE
jgi:hypothetical protein